MDIYYTHTETQTQTDTHKHTHKQSTHDEQFSLRVTLSINISGKYKSFFGNKN